MAAPYVIDQEAVRFVVQGDTVQVYTTRIKDIEQHQADRWRVWDHAGIPHEVDRDGVGKMIVPMDAEWQQELADRGEGFTVVEEQRLRGLELVEEMPPQSLDGGRDGGL
jgi:hypothetical protein